MNWEYLCPLAEAYDLSHLSTPFAEEEIRLAVFDLGPDKSPGPYGVPLRFYHCFWSMLRSDIMQIFDSLYKGTLQLHKINNAFITFIPKKDGASTVEDYRPISLLNEIYKIVTKVIASHLNSVITKLVDESQFAFIKGRSSLQSVALAQEIMATYHSKRWEALLWQIDFHNVFDTLD